MPTIHPTAVVAPGAVLAPSTVVGPFVTIEDGVEVGAETELLTGTILLQGSRIGARCKLGPYAVIGGEPMDSAFRGEESCAVLEEGVEAREFATIHRATGEGSETCVGRNTLLMSYTHVSHNVRVGPGTTLATSVQLGGHVQVGAHAFLGANALTHQFVRIGDHAMLAGGSAALQDILPYCLAAKTPALHFGLNRVGLRRRGFTGERYTLLERAVRALRSNDQTRFEALAATSNDVAAMQRFRDNSERGIARFVVQRL